MRQLQPSAAAGCIAGRDGLTSDVERALITGIGAATLARDALPFAFDLVAGADAALVVAGAGISLAAGAGRASVAINAEQ